MIPITRTREDVRSAFAFAVATQRAPCSRARAAGAADSLAASRWRSRRTMPRRVAPQGHSAPTPKRFEPQIPERPHESVPNPVVTTPRMPSGPVRKPPFPTSLPLPSGGAAEVPSRNEGDRSGAAGFLAHPERRREVGAAQAARRGVCAPIAGTVPRGCVERPQVSPRSPDGQLARAAQQRRLLERRNAPA